MNYLYGDSTASELTSNFLEFLRDSIDFCVFVLQADTRMKAGRVRIREMGEESDAESGRLERFITSVSRAVHGGDKGAPDSPTAQCGTRLAALIVDAHRTSIDGIRHTLAEAIARIEAEEAAGRDGCVKALGALLAPHEPPNAATVLRLGLADSGRYDATLLGSSEPGLEWTLEVGIPDGHAWSATMRVDRMVQYLEIRAPQLAGWIRKEVAVKPQRLERMIVTQVVDDGETVSIDLRTEPASQIGFDFEVDLIDEKIVKSVRIGPAEDSSIGPFDIQNEDMPLILDLAKKTRASLMGVERRPNISATFNKADFRTLPTFVDFVEDLVGMMAPIVREIAARSLTPNELVLRRPLANDRREEIFVAKATLREKLAVLPNESRALFAPLGLEVPAKAAPAPPQPPSDRPPVRSEIPASAPPAKPVIAGPPAPRPKSVAPPAPAPAPGSAPVAPVTTFAPVRSSPPPPTSNNNASNAVSPVRTLQPTAGAAPPPPSAVPHPSPPPAPVVVASPPPPPPPPPPLPTTNGGSESKSDSKSEAPQLEISEEEVELNGDDVLMEIVPESKRELVAKPEPGHGRNEALVAALKKIMMLSKNGRATEAYWEYASLFSSEAFQKYRVDEQRQALKLMVLAKTHPADSADAVASAHRAALRRLQSLVDSTGEPVDQEMLGMTHLYLGDEKAASKAFQAGLDVERVKNPQSELIATLMRRVSQL